MALGVNSVEMKTAKETQELSSYIYFFQLLLYSWALYETFPSNIERINLDYSKKNILIPSQKECKLQLVAKAEHFIKLARWKALQFVGKLNAQEKKIYGFRTRNCPPPSKGLKQFEDDLMCMVRNSEFRQYSNDFQEHVRQDIRNFKQSRKFIVPTDKSGNMYKMEKSKYKKHLSNCITSDYTNVKSINLESKNIAKSLDLDERMEVL